MHSLRETAQGRRTLYRAGKSLTGFYRKTARSRIPHTERRFVCWDGEGVTEPSTNAHYYVLFGNSDGDYISGDSLATHDCLRLLIDSADPDAIHFGFAFNYDVNMILKDLPKNHWRILIDEGWVRWGDFRINYMPRKWFQVTDRYKKQTVKIWDVWSFFMTSFVVACSQYGIDLAELVTSGKEDRSSFKLDELETKILPYWKEENDKAVELLESLRHSLYGANLLITQWHGPGAIASYSMGQHRMGEAMRTPPEQVLRASQYAYGGGRFELFKVGRANCKVYEYDINSAYPYAISQLPNLSRGEWKHVTEPTTIARFGVYRISWRQNPYRPMANVLRPHPFLYRNEKGLISYPCINDTWVWSPELWRTHNFPGLEIHEGWEFVENSDDRPFEWLAQNYELRQKYKREGNQAQYALKLQMNSMYGKMAQRVGWNEARNTPPKWHQLEWAGWVVSYCRAMVFQASLLAGTNLVAFETDAVFSTTPIDFGKGSQGFTIGTRLGDWEATTYDDFIYLQSGCRFGLNPRVNGKRKHNGWQPKYRGFDKGSIDVRKVKRVLAKDPEHWEITGTTTRFIGAKQAMQTDWSSWRKFITTERTLRIGGEGKRQHIPNLCRACANGIPGSQGFHDCVLANPMGGASHPHPLPWNGPLDTVQENIDDSKWEMQ